MQNEFNKLQNQIVKNYQIKKNAIYLAGALSIVGLLIDIVSGIINITKSNQSYGVAHTPAFLIFVGPYRYIVASFMLIAILISLYAIIDRTGNKYCQQINNTPQLKLKTIQHLNHLCDDMQQTTQNIEKLKHLLQTNQVNEDNINPTLAKIEKLEKNQNQLKNTQKAYKNIAYELYQYSKFSI